MQPTRQISPHPSPILWRAHNPAQYAIRNTPHQPPIFQRLALLLLVLLLAGCSTPNIPGIPVEIPGNPQLPNLDQLRDLGLPDLSNIPNLPQISELPFLNVGDSAIVFAGPTERRIAVGERIPGTDIVLTTIADGKAEFQIGGQRAPRAIGDSLDFDGNWPGIGGVTYNLRLRLYLVSQESVRAAGVHRLLVENIGAQEQAVTPQGTLLKIPYAGSANQGERLKGNSLGYVGSGERGAEFSGLPGGDFPYRKVGDSLVWRGFLRSDIPIEYNIRVAFYNDTSVQVAGIATLQLP